ncbi:MAG: hypothetical protein P1V97_28800 [Planctomycetota bacterium]|nr:hypothetical protein [Planctomycetota bacterium]
MGWARFYIEKLTQGETVAFRPRGHSMKGKIASGQLVKVRPIGACEELSIDDIVLCRVRGNDYLHLVTATDKDRYQIGNNRGFINGWIHKSKVFGLCIEIEGKAVKLKT